MKSFWMYEEHINGKRSSVPLRIPFYHRGRQLYCVHIPRREEPCFQDGWTGLDAWGPSRTSRTINRRPGRLIDPGRVPWSSWSSPIWGTYIYHIYNIYIYYSYNNTYITPYIYTHTHTYILHLLGYR